MRHCCENCGWLDVNPGGALFCGYTDERTWKDECCMAWKDKEIPQTNADKIRQMSDEELAEYMSRIIHTVKTANKWWGLPSDKKEDWLDWLKEEEGV